MGGPYSGKWGVVNGVSTVTNWSIQDAMEPKPFFASNTQWGQGNRLGVESWDGSYQCLSGVPAVLPGQQFSFVGYGAPINNFSGNGWRYAGQALCEQAVVTWNWEGGDILTCQETFKGHLQLTEQGSTGAAITDETVPDAPPVACTKIEYSLNGSDWSEWENLTNAVLTMTVALQSYVNSSTVVNDGGTCRIWTGQRPTNYSWTLAVTEQDLDRPNLFVKGAKLQLKLYINSTKFYLLKWGQVKDFTGIEVSRADGSIVKQTVNIDMSGVDPTAGSYATAVGQVLLPDESQWWPFSGSGTGT